ncbi:MAG: hypothetical protein ACRC6I_04110 [Paracoccaceae bacterium]
MDVGRGEDGAEIRGRRLVMAGALGRLIGVVGLLAVLSQPVAGQMVDDMGSEIRSLGTVQVGDHQAGFVIGYGPDAAVLMLSVAGADGMPGYVPLFASTYRGIPAVTLDVFAAKAGDAIWVQSSWPGTEVLGYYRFGDAAALTPFGEQALLETAVPQGLSGGAVAFPPMEAGVVRKIASFYLADEP